MKILIIGANGMLGYTMVRFFETCGYSVESITRNGFDITRDKIERIRENIANSDFVVNCAGIIKSRINNFTIEEILIVNVVFPRNLSQLCKKYNIPYFHITTDCVFSGKRGNYIESDYYDAEDIYGLSKCSGEFPDGMVLRASFIGEEKYNSRSLLEWLKRNKGGTINGFTNHFWNGMTALYLAEIIDYIINQHLYEPGIYHLFSDKIISKFELLRMINDIYSLQIKINKFETPELCDRSLSTEKELCQKVVKKTLWTQITELYIFFNNI